MLYIFVPINWTLILMSSKKICEGNFHFRIFCRGFFLFEKFYTFFSLRSFSIPMQLNMKLDGEIGRAKLNRGARTYPDSLVDKNVYW